MVKQVLVVAGGYGKRMPISINPKRNKPLIEYAGQPMLGHLIDGLKGGDFDRYLFAAGDHNYQRVREIVEEKGITKRSKVIPLLVGGFRRVPYFLQDFLDEKFMIVCGHQPIPGDFVLKMQELSDRADCVMTSYNNSDYPFNRDVRIMFNGSTEKPRLGLVNIKTDKVSENHNYASNPYVVVKEVLFLSKEDRFRESFSHYIYWYYVHGKGSLLIIPACMPPEFDLEREFRKTKAFLDDLVKKPNQ